MQGFTEFLPISSSAHLLLPSLLLGWPDQGVLFDVALHVGTLFAVMIYFRQELTKMVLDSLKWLRTGEITENSRMAWYLAWGTVPAVFFGGILTLTGWDDQLRALWVIVVATILFALLLLWADKAGRQARGIESLSLKDVLLIGLAQAVALIPGTSRSGITLTAGLWLGFKPEAAARFSFLLSVPVIIMAGGLKLIQLMLNPQLWDLSVLFSAVFISGVSAYLCIHFFLKLIVRIGMMPFVIYRIGLGLVLAGLLFERYMVV